jgi:hypothetical protein
MTIKIGILTSLNLNNCKQELLFLLFTDNQPPTHFPRILSVLRRSLY